MMCTHGCGTSLEMFGVFEDEDRSIEHTAVRCRDALKATLEAQRKALSDLSFEAEWAKKEQIGYQYGEDAIEQVRFGFEIAVEALIVKPTEEKT